VSRATAEERSRSGLASTLALTLAVVAIASGVARFIVEGMRAADVCETTLSLIKIILTWTILVSSILAMIAGIVALVSRSGRVSWAVVGVVGGAVAVTTMLATASGCGIGTA
jgi:prolipoprotein diacylglyceryltransferase